MDISYFATKQSNSFPMHPRTQCKELMTQIYVGGLWLEFLVIQICVGGTNFGLCC